MVEAARRGLAPALERGTKTAERAWRVRHLAQRLWREGLSRAVRGARIPTRRIRPLLARPDLQRRRAVRHMGSGGRHADARFRRHVPLSKASTVVGRGRVRAVDAGQPAVERLARETLLLVS